MTETALAVKSPREILELTRRIFAATHWTDGNYGVAYEPTKLSMCSVGGIRYAALAPMDHALDSAWMVAHRYYADVRPSDEDGYPDGSERELAEATVGNYIVALEALARVIKPRWMQEEYPRFDGSPALQIANLEDKIVDWNDGFMEDDDPDERRAVVDTEILPAFDDAIAALNEGSTT